MTAERLVATDRLRAALAAAYGAAAGAAARPHHRPPVVGTEHLLLGLAAARPGSGPDPGPGPAAQVLAEAELTGPVLLAVLRRRAGRPAAWRSDDRAGDPGPADGPDREDRAGAQPSLGELDWFRPGKPIDYTGAARAALGHAAAAARQGHALDSDQVLHGLLAVDGCRARELLRACGVDPAWLRDRLRDRVCGTGPAPVADDPVPPELRPTRDGLLGRTTYRGAGRHRSRWAGGFRWLPLAEVPAVWVMVDAHDQARRLGAPRTGTEHLVLAVLAVHETLDRYPHLRPDDAGHRYAGGAVLAAAGLTYRAAREVARAHADRLGTDARKASAYSGRRWRTRAAPTGTAELLLAVLTQDDSRAAHLLRRSGLPPARVRVQLRARPSDGQAPHQAQVARDAGSSGCR